MSASIESLAADIPPDPVFVFSNHHSRAFVDRLAESSIDAATAVFFPIGSVRNGGDEIPKLATTSGWRVLTTFVSPGIVDAVAEGSVEYVPVRTSVHADFVARRFSDRHLVFVGHVPPSRDDEYTFGIACPHGPLLFDEADTTVAVVNDSLPVVPGPTRSTDKWTFQTVTDEPLPTFQRSQTDSHEQIAVHVASLVPDGATIQLGIGAIPHAVTRALQEKSDLAVHSGVISEGVLELSAAGAITGRPENPVLTSLLVGESPDFYTRVEGDDGIRLAPATRIHNPTVIGKYDTFVSINSAIEVDLAGQVNASHIGRKQYAAPGGILDFVEGAHSSPHGRSVIAMEARAKPDIPKIVPTLGDGAPVDVPRTNVDYVVTEYGIARLLDRTPRERIDALLQVAHPDDRAELARTVRERKRG